jgi:hypothetical protein
MKNRIYTNNDYIDVDKYEKSRYQIICNGAVLYTYVTTCRSPEESVTLLSEKAKTIHACIHKGYRIYRITKTDKELICVGKKSIL